MTKPNEPRITLAGMALQNGVLIVGPYHCGAAWYDKNHQLQVTTWNFEKEALKTINKIPLLRGLGSGGMLFATLPQLKIHAPGAKLAFENPLMLATGILTPLALNQLAKRWGAKSVKTILVAGVSPLLISLLTTKLSVVGKFHGAEHKSIGAYENDQTAKETAKEHPRCGTQLALPMVITSTLAQLAMRNMPISNQTKFLTQIMSVMLSVEITKAARDAKDSTLGKLITNSGLTLQSYFTVREPDADQLKCGVLATNAVLAAEGLSAQVQSV